MNKIAGIITKDVPGYKSMAKIVPVMSVANFNLGLLKDRQWAIGIDQSTSCTGLCFRDLSGEYRIILDLYHDQQVSKVKYFRDLFYLLKRCVEGCDIRYLVYERPAPKDMYASRVLQELKGHLEDWIDNIPEFEFTVVESMFPQTWKKYIVDKSKGKGRTRIKSAIAQDLVDRFPLLQDYYDIYPFKDYDSFDATGIIEGYFMYAFDSVGNEKIHGVIEKSHVTKVGYYWCDRDKMTTVPKDVFGELLPVFSPKMMVQAEDKNLHENIRMASSNNRCVVTTLNRKQLSPFMWKYQIDIDDPNKVMFMFVLRKGDFSNKEIQLFEQCVPWNEEVTG